MDHPFPKGIGHGEELEDTRPAPVPVGARSASATLTTPALSAQSANQALGHHTGKAAGQEIGGDPHIQ